eukprot:361167-Amorphochlora_amoeboformis.AAC.2
MPGIDGGFQKRFGDFYENLCGSPVVDSKELRCRFADKGWGISVRQSDAVNDAVVLENYLFSLGS